jgi:plasmid maintenance system antidote protein VapI
MPKTDSVAVEPRLLTVAAAARRLHVRESTIHELIAIGVLRV